MKKVFKTNLLYLSVTGFLLGWWWMAFGGDYSKAKGIFPSSDDPYLSSPKKNEVALLSKIQRSELLQALAGDPDAMYRQILDWDTDAYLMAASGMPYMERLPSAELDRIRAVYRRIAFRIPSKKQMPYVVDDVGNTISLTMNYSRFLPQTYVAADFLMALVPPSHIVALPGNLRSHVDLYPKEITDQIKLDIERQNSEKLYAENPQIAFVAHYSNPSTVHALTNQGITLYTMRSPDTLEDITSELKQLGQIVDQADKAELLSSFMQAAMIAIDNQFSLLASADDPQKILFINYHYTFSLPTTKTLNGKLIARLESKSPHLKLPYAIDNPTEWTIPISREEIVNINPQYLIVTGANPELILQEIKRDPALSTVEAVKKGRIATLNETIQHSPSQYIVLAYFDLLQTLQDLP